MNLGQRGSGCKAGNSPAWRMICHVLQSGKALSSLEISQKIGISRQHVYAELRSHHPSDVHVSEYGERGPTGYRPKLWKLGPGQDAPRPKPMTQAEMNRRRWKNIKKNHPELLAKRDAKKRLKYAEQKGRLIRRDEAAAWLTGVDA